MSGMHGRGAAGLLVGLALMGGCNRGPRVEVAKEADAGGIEIRASSEQAGDSTRVNVIVTNRLDTSADITFNGGCPITLLTVDLEGRVRWDEREHVECDEPDLPIPLAPHEYTVLHHAVHVDDIPAYSEGDTQLAARVLVAVAEEYILEADGD